jgi:histidyl-tRNA synthetase
MAGPYVGTRDFYPEDMRFRSRMFDVLRARLRVVRVRAIQCAAA